MSKYKVATIRDGWKRTDRITVIAVKDIKTVTAKSHHEAKKRYAQRVFGNPKRTKRLVSTKIK